MMAGNKRSDDQSEPTRNLHISVPESFHRRVKLMCAFTDKTLKDYSIEAIEERVKRDEAELKKSR